MITHERHVPAVGSFAHRTYGRAADRSLELDQRMSRIMRVGRTGLAVGTEIGIVTDGAFVAVTTDEGSRRPARTERAVAHRPQMILRRRRRRRSRDGLGDGHEPMAWVNERRIRDAARAVVPIGTLQALMTHTHDDLAKRRRSARRDGTMGKSRRGEDNHSPYRSRRRWRGGERSGPAHTGPGRRDRELRRPECSRRCDGGGVRVWSRSDRPCTARNHHRRST